MLRHKSKTKDSTKNVPHDGRQRSATSLVENVLRASGQPLESQTRADMESRLGHNFGRVRVHTDAQAAESANAVHAQAYTAGHDIVFGDGRYAPHSVEGKKLLAHELAHTIQQSETLSNPGGELSVGPANSVFEREADLAAEGLSHVAATPSAPSLQKKDLTAEEFAEKALTAGPKGKTEKTQFEAAGAKAAAIDKAGTKITRVEVPAKVTEAGAKAVTTSEFEAEAKKCATTRAEGGLPKAFLCVTNEPEASNIRPDDDAKMDTNVRVSFKSGKTNEGSIWVVSASLAWPLNTAGFLDISVIDPSMLSAYQAHEKGHSTIARKIHERLARLMQVELEGALPTDKKPIIKSGKTWGQDGVDEIAKKIEAIQKRYKDWFDELSTAADAGWDTQEKATLSKIAAALKAKEYRPGRAPELKDEKDE